MRIVGPYDGSPFIIYALCEPDTLDVRYVGMSRRGLVRPAAHLRRSSQVRAITAKNEWICSLARHGLEPVVRVLGEFESAECLCEAEREAIAWLREQGAKLTNIATGGVPTWALSLACHRRTAKATRDRLTPFEKAERAYLRRIGQQESLEAWIKSEIKKGSEVGQYLDRRRAKVAAALGMSVQQAIAAVTFEPAQYEEAA